MIAAACRFHRAPYAVYAGFNARVRVRGIQPPRRLQPSPLHLILRSLSPRDRPGRAAPSTRSSSSTWTRTDRSSETGHVHPRPRGPPAVARRAPSAIPRRPARCSTSSTRATVRGTFFVVGEIAEAHPELVARGRGARPRGRAARLASPAAHRARPPTRSAPTCSRGKALLEDLAGTPVVGFRAPTFSLVPESRLGRRRPRRDRLHVLVERPPRPQPAVRRPDAARPPRSAGPTGWSSSRARWCGPGASGSPTSAASTCARIPGAASTAVRRSVGRGQLLWIYCHPYDFDPDEEFWVVPDAGRWGSRLLWYNRRRAFAKVESVLRGRAGPPLAERLHEVTASDVSTATSRNSRWCTGCRRRRSSIASRTCGTCRATDGSSTSASSTQAVSSSTSSREPGSTSTSRGVASELVGIDLDEAGVADARCAGTRRTRSTAATSTPSAPSGSRPPTW